MNNEDIIKHYRLGLDSRVKFKNDPQQYWIKNISPDRKNVFVHINGMQTYRKLIKNIIQVDNKKLNELKSHGGASVFQGDKGKAWIEYKGKFIEVNVLSRDPNPPNQIKIELPHGKIKTISPLEVFKTKPKSLNEESLKNLVIKKIQDSTFSKEEKEKMIKKCENPQELKNILMKIDEKESLKEMIRKTLKEISLKPTPGSIGLEQGPQGPRKKHVIEIVKDQLNELIDEFSKTPMNRNKQNELVDFFSENIVNLVINPSNLEEKFDGDIKSTLEKIVQQAWAEKDLTKAKQIVTDYLTSSKIKEEDKKKMMTTINGINNKYKLDYYLANSLLTYEGSGLGQLNKKELKEHQCSCASNKTKKK